MKKPKWMPKKQREQIIEAINIWCENNDTNDTTVTMLGTKEEQADYAPAILGMVAHPGKPAVIYSYRKIIECFMHNNRWDWETAAEWVDYNIMRGLAYIPADENPPCIQEDLD